MTNHETFIRRAYDLAREAVAHGNHPFGALLVRDGEVIFTAENTIYTEHDPTRHAELNLVSLAARQFGVEALKDCILYTSTEPCPMCAGAIYWAGVRTIVFGCSAAAFGQLVGAGGFSLSSAQLFGFAHDPVQVIGPILEDEGLAVHKAYWR